MSRLLRRLAAPYPLALLALVSLYTLIFTRLAFAQHAAMRTHRSDLGQIAQAVWNSSRGRFVEMTDNGYLATRLSDHVEPILALVSPVLWLWANVRALLLLQVLAAAVGAFFVYALALRRFDTLLTARERTHVWQVEPLRALTQPLALAFAAAYLLAPQLQSALLTEFHAAPLAAPLILWAFWAVDARRWVQFALAAVLVALVKEEMALLAAGLGAWAMWQILLSRGAGEQGSKGAGKIIQASPLLLRSLAPLLCTSFLVVASLAWFYATTFVIVPAYAEPVYGVAESGYFARYGALGDSPVDILRSVATRPDLVWQIASEPARAAYLRHLLMAFGFLSLLAPEILLLALPVLLANLLSAYPAQYYGDFHYSAPLVPYFAVSAIYGAARLWRWVGRRANRSSASFQHMPAASTGTMALVSLFHNSRTALRPLLAFALGTWLLSFALVLYAQDGRGPLGGDYDPTPVTEHHELLPRFVDQIPADAAVTATAAVHPHLALRRFVYQFPLGLPNPDGDPRLLGNADWALLDVTTNTDMAPGDLHARVQQMLAADWGVVDGADGFLLLRRDVPSKEIPMAFYDFARSQGQPSPGVPPLQATNVSLEDWPRWRQTKVTTVWQVGDDFDADVTSPHLNVRTPNGDSVYSFAQSTPPALVWYPPSQWQPGDTIRATTLWLWLPKTWGVFAGIGGDEELLAIYAREDNALIEREALVAVEESEPLVPDQACALIAASCASQ